MEFNPQQLVFYLFALLTIGSAVIVVTIKNIVYAAFSLMVTLFSVAGLYVFLQADFLAATQVIVYVGGILVLILFGVMMTSGRLDLKLKLERGQMFWGRDRITNPVWLASECHYKHAAMGKRGRRGITGTDNKKDWRNDYEGGIFTAI